MRRDDFFDADFFEEELRVLFFALLLREVRDRELLLDFLLVAFLVAMTILLGGQMTHGFRQVVSGSLQKRDVRSRVIERLHDAANAGYAHERIGDEPRSNACECAGNGKLEKRGRDEWVQQQADADQHRRMDDVDGICTSIEP